MILLDTNVLSELVNPDGDSTVHDWMDAMSATEPAMCTISVEEMHFGLQLMPEGRRRRQLIQAVGIMQDRLTCWNFDVSAAKYCAEFRAVRQRAGRRIELPDAQIAGVAKARGAAIATRNLRDFTSLGVEIVNPWGD